MPDKPKNHSPRYARYTVEAALYLALAVFGLSIIFVVEGWVADHPARIYWLYAFYYQNVVNLGCVAIPLLTLILLTIFLVIAVISRYRTRIYSVVALLMLTANVLFCVSSVSVFFGEYAYYARLSAGNYVYYADSEWKVGVGNNHRMWFMLHRCDSLGLACEIVFSKRYNRYEIEEYSPFNVQLTAEGGSVIFKIEGEVVYAEQP